MDWPEVNCLLEALGALIEKYQTRLGDEALSDDDRSDLSNDLAYAQVLKGKYTTVRSDLSKA